MKISNKQLYYFLLIVAAIKIFFSFFLELGNDESYYYTYALKPQLNYFDHPPMVGILMRITTLNLSFVNDEVKNYLKKNSKSFDVLILSHILEHLDNPKQIIMDCKPFIKFMYIELPDFDKSYMNHYRRDLGCDLIYTDIDHVSEFDRIEMKTLINECGFTLIESEYRFGIQRHWCENNG